jgi:polysaccharide export outer membrane protein
MKKIPHLLLRWLVPLAAIFMLMAGRPALRADPPSSEIDIPSYTLTATDRLRIVIYQEDDLSSIVRIDSNGNVNLPLVGEVKVANLTVPQAQNAVEDAYRNGRFLRNPQVIISVEEYAPREVSIGGQVRNPGRYPLPIESVMTVVDLVTKAGGLTDIARGNSVTITHITPDGQKITSTVDVDSIIKGRAKADNKALQLQPGDIVYVPERII